MVIAELSHNPFLLETKAEFNGHRPLVNSAIDRYKHKPLVTWVEKVPQIFHDELNGYGFDLFFSGTDADYDYVRDAFRKAGVPDDSVRILRKGSLGSPMEKFGQVQWLVRWLGENRNSHLDYEAMIEWNPSLTNAVFSLILVRCDMEVESQSRLAFERIDDVSVLADTNLTLTPIVINVTPGSVDRMGDDVRHLLARQDVTARQLFFIIHHALKREQVTRVLSDLGARDPQVVGAANDPQVIAYVQNYLVAEYVRNSIRILDGEADRISDELQAESAQGERLSKPRWKRLEQLESEVARLREADNAFARLSEASAPRGFATSKEAFYRSVTEWNNNKRLVQGRAEGEAMAQDLDRTVSGLFSRVSGELSSLTSDARSRIDTELRNIYRDAGVDVEYAPYASPLAFPPAPRLPFMAKEFLSLGVTTTVTQRHDFFGLFAAPATQSGERTEVTTYYLDDWRKKAMELTTPTINLMCNAYLQTLKSYQQWATQSYRSHISELIRDKTDESELLLGMLSGEEVEMRDHVDWLKEFKSQLQHIKRG